MHIHLDQLWKSFGPKTVLKGLSLEVDQGETYCIIGRSGAGKSVTLKHITGLMKPDRGKIMIDGKDVTNTSERKYDALRKRMGVVFQDAALIKWLSVGENVALPLRELDRIRDREIRTRVAEKLALVELKGCEALMPDSISGGMKKRVGIARAMIRDPELILFDEPTSGLDPVMSNQINELVLHLQERTGVTSLVVTHDMTSAYMIGNRIGMFYQGEIIDEGTPEDIQGSTNPITRQFIEGRPRGPITTGDEKFIVHEEAEEAEPESYTGDSESDGSSQEVEE